MIPPKENAAFVACMENVLDLYHRPYDPKRPLLAMDEHPVQLIGETRMPVPEIRGIPDVTTMSMSVTAQPRISCSSSP